MAWVFGIGVFLFLAFTFPKQVGFLLLLAVGGIALVVVGNNRQEERRAAEIGKVIIRARTSNLCNDPQRPIEISFSNQSGKVVNAVDFRLSATRPGYSSSLVTSYMSSDKIIAPGEAFLACWSPVDYGHKLGQLSGFNVTDLIWHVSTSNVTFGR